MKKQEERCLKRIKVKQDQIKENTFLKKLKRTGRHWYNNGEVNKFCYECPDGFTPGKLR